MGRSEALKSNAVDSSLDRAGGALNAPSAGKLRVPSASPQDSSLDPASDANAIGRETERIAAEAADEARRMAQEAQKDAATALTKEMPAPMTEKAKDPYAGDEPNQEYMKGHAKKPAAKAEPSGNDEKDKGDATAESATAGETVNTDDALTKARFAAKDAGHVQLPKKENAVQKVGSYIASWLHFAKGTTTGTYNLVKSGIQSAAGAAFGPKQIKSGVSEAAKKGKEPVATTDEGNSTTTEVNKQQSASEAKKPVDEHMTASFMEKSKQASANAWVKAKDASAAGWQKTKSATASGWQKTKEATVSGWQKTKSATVSGWQKTKDATSAALSKTRDASVAGWEKTKDMASSWRGGEAPKPTEQSLEAEEQSESVSASQQPVKTVPVVSPLVAAIPQDATPPLDNDTSTFAAKNKGIGAARAMPTGTLQAASG